MRRIVSDTGPLLHLTEVQALHLLELAGEMRRTPTGKPRVEPSADWFGPTQGYGRHNQRLMLADCGFAGELWLAHWAHDYAAHIVTPPSAAEHPGFDALRQVVETAFAHLCDSFGWQYPGAHSTWGLITRIAAKLAAYAGGIDINRMLGRPDFAFSTLIG